MKKELILVAIMILIVVISSTFIVYKLSVSGQIIDNEDLKIKENQGINKEELNISNKEQDFKESKVSESEVGFVSKIIDGDTIIVDGKSVRLLGIDADERGYECYDDAKKWLENKILNQEVRLIRDGENKDQYDRYLRYILISKENINLELVENGLAVARLYSDNVKYSEEILNAEKNARKNRKGCKWDGYDSQTEEGVRLGDEEDLELHEGVVGACNAGNYIGEEKKVEGKVVSVYRSKSDTVFLNFEKSYPNQCFTAVIFKSFLNEFDYKSYENKRIRIEGKIEEYNGKPEIILKDKKQIEIIDGVGN